MWLVCRQYPPWHTNRNPLFLPASVCVSAVMNTYCRLHSFSFCLCYKLLLFSSLSVCGVKTSIGTHAERLTGACSVPSSLSMLPLLFLDSVFCKRQRGIFQLYETKHALQSTFHDDKRIIPDCSCTNENILQQFVIVPPSRRECGHLATTESVLRKQLYPSMTPNSRSLFQYRFGEAGLEEMHPGRIEAE